jgi:hypothetical protein
MPVRQGELGRSEIAAAGLPTQRNAAKAGGNLTP